MSHEFPREKWRGHLRQERFSSFPMDEMHLFASGHYVEINPEDACIVTDPADYRWSSARAHLNGADDALALVSPLLNMVSGWGGILEIILSRGAGNTSSP